MSPRSRELNQEMRAQSRAALIDAARQLFAERGYFNCKVSDIARAAGMSQGNVYWYFEGKEALLQAVLGDGFEALGGAMEAAAAAPGSGPDKLEALLDNLLAFQAERGAFNQVLLSLLGHGGPSFLSELGFDMDHWGLRYTRAIAAILRQCQVEGHMPRELDHELHTMFFFGLFNGLNLTYGEAWAELPREVLRGAIFRLFGIQPSPSRS
jgi:AcrR family transcriptional regulator